MTKPAAELIGVVHLEALPGAPRNRFSIEEIEALAVRDAEAWETGGADRVLIENFGDTPFFPGRVPPETVAAMSRIGVAVGRAIGLRIGFNVLRNDAEAALALCEACGGSFLRVNVLTHAYVTDQGILSGRAHLLARKRKELGSTATIFADILVKHAAPLAPLDIAPAARDLLARGGADALIITGTGTGQPTDPAFARTVRDAIGPAEKLYVGSGTTPDTAGALLPFVDGFIVGTYAKRDARVDSDRVRAIARALVPARAS